MARSRDWSEEYGRRNAKARALGYKGYYDYRAHDNGRIPPSAPPLKGENLRKASGHRSRADLIRQSKGGTVSVLSTERNKKGQVTRAQILLIDKDGDEKTFWLTGKQLTTKNLDDLAEQLTAGGTKFAPSPSLDIRRLVSDDDDLTGEEFAELAA